MRMRDPGWKQFGSGIRIEKSRMRDPGLTSRIRNTDWVYFHEWKLNLHFEADLTDNFRNCSKSNKTKIEHGTGKAVAGFQYGFSA
jgi:hypothetical protein